MEQYFDANLHLFDHWNFMQWNMKVKETMTFQQWLIRKGLIQVHD